ncbi:hypothetical protein LJK88_25545 [Paenibacillus sp. P26]|nr:hypothetical protein LJK88_25545 [Paenibacillus sp. P26]UUZ95221.1 hypothetical protein LJK87_12425 [Paenibacillus sp. P25]
MNKATPGVRRPERSEEELQAMFERLKESRLKYVKVTITVDGVHGNRQYTGIVTGLDPRLYLVKMQVGHDWMLFEFTDMIEVEYAV